jgi:hypothetical protein
MKVFIDFNTEMRKKATSDFEKNFWKLLNNASFGKTIEQKITRQNVVIVGSEEQCFRYVKKPTVQNIIPIDEDISIFLMKKLSVCLDKPICVGVSVLEIAKSIMYQMHYEVMQPKYGNNIKLVYTDTDSLIYLVNTEDIYKDMMTMNVYDMSDYPPNHPTLGQFYNPINKKVLGKFKDECAQYGRIITYIVALRPKLYATRSIEHVKEKDEHGKETGPYIQEDGKFETRIVLDKKAKGLAKSAVEKYVTMDHYKKALEENLQTYVKMKRIQSFRHQLFTLELEKKGLNAFCSKRYGVDFLNTLPFGHKDIPV